MQDWCIGAVFVFSRSRNLMKLTFFYFVVRVKVGNPRSQTRNTLNKKIILYQPVYSVAVYSVAAQF